MIRHPWSVLAVLAAASVSLSAPSPALAGGSLECDILEIKASDGERRIDRELRPLEKKLKRPPFSSWKRFELLKRHRSKLPRLRAVEQKLVPGGKLSLLYRDLTREEGKKPRLHLTFTLDDRQGKRKLDGTIHFDAGDHYVIGGDPLPDGGTYILAIGCAAP